MTTSLRSTIHAELGWTWRDVAGSALVTNSNRLRLVQDLDDGHDENQAEAVWDAADQALAAGGSVTFELDSLERPIFGDTICVSLLKVKAILIVNKSGGGSGYLLVGGAAADEWHAPFGAAGDTVKVMPGAGLLLSHPRDGWSVEAGANQLKIAAVGDAVLFDVAILGTTSADSS
jgi:hypothetical protein